MANVKIPQRTPKTRMRDMIGFYGCGRLVSVGWSGTGKPPRTVSLDCPCCGFHRSPILPSWREAKDGENAEVEL